jgi:hypothetical protein
MNQQALASKNSQEIPPDDHKRLEKAGDFSSQFQAPEFKAKFARARNGTIIWQL